jgi:myosin heavy subunit
VECISDSTATLGEAGWDERREVTFDLSEERWVSTLEVGADGHAQLPLQNDHTGTVDDMTGLNYLHEPAILYNVRKRFFHGMPYTYTGNICVAVNPYKRLHHLYSKELQEEYHDQPRDKMPPHVFGASTAAFRSLNDKGLNQSILVSGESGAGKTETTKFLMAHVALMANGAKAKKFQQRGGVRRFCTLEISLLSEPFVLEISLLPERFVLKNTPTDLHFVLTYFYWLNIL